MRFQLIKRTEAVSIVKAGSVFKSLWRLPESIGFSPRIPDLNNFPARLPVSKPVRVSKLCNKKNPHFEKPISVAESV